MIDIFLSFFLAIYNACVFWYLVTSNFGMTNEDGFYKQLLVSGLIHCKKKNDDPTSKQEEKDDKSYCFMSWKSSLISILNFLKVVYFISPAFRIFYIRFTYIKSSLFSTQFKRVLERLMYVCNITVLIFRLYRKRLYWPCFCCELFAYEFYGNTKQIAVIKMIKENKWKINISMMPALVIAAELFKIT